MPNTHLLQFPCVVSVRQSGSYGGYPIWSVALYAAVPRKKDGVPTWRLVRDLENCHRGAARAQKARITWAEELRLPFYNVSYGTEVHLPFEGSQGADL